MKRIHKRYRILLYLIGAVLILYPFIATRYNLRHQSTVTSDYQEEMAASDTSALDAARARAKAYNDGLRDGSIDGLDPKGSGYAEQLALSDVMGSIRIPAIDVDMPILHGVSSQAMTAGAGHMSNTSLPIGGRSTHCVISSHSGLASHRGFTDLPELEIGDLFYVDVLGETHCYEVTQIQTVLPHEVETVRIVEGKDLFSLVTCVPVFINSHRLVVTGTRIADPPKGSADKPKPTMEAPSPEHPTEELPLRACFLGIGACGIAAYYIRSHWGNPK